MTEKEKDDLIEALRDYYRDSIFVTDGAGNVIFSNEVASQRIGLPIDELEGRNVRDMVEEGVYSYSTVMEAIRTKREVAAEINSTNDLHTFSNSVPIMDENGKVCMVVTNNISIERTKEWKEIIDREKQKSDMLRRELDYLRLRDKRVIISNSREMKDVLNSVYTIASSDANIVILGESGTGKDMIAQIIHEQSWRSNESFISINCAAMPENLLESELFGYEGGAFTGALSKGKIGLFEAASGGTLFLDEIGEMSPSLQSRLLRVIENHEIRRVGGVENIPVNVRIICATNSDLEAMVQAKTFREDLYYRLAVFTIRLPRLADRLDDIMPLAELFLRELNEKYNTHKHFSEITIDTMKNYSWPGNIRELRNVVERIFVVSRGDELVFTPVPTASYGQYFSEVPNPLIGNDDLTLKEFTDRVESQYITKILDECGGVVTEAAKRLGVHRSVIYRKLNRTDTEIVRES